MRFLIDECLSPDLVTLASLEGHEAYHIAHIGMAGRSDRHIARYAHDGDFVVVTNNADDFRRLYAAESFHAGLVILRHNVAAPAQRQLFGGALRELEAGEEPINQVIEAGFDGGDVICFRYDFPSKT